MRTKLWLGLLACTATLTEAACLSTGNEDTINNMYQLGGAGTVVQLCPSVIYNVTGRIKFTAANQELSTQGYPTDSTRAIIRLNPGSSPATIILGPNLDGIRLLNIQFDGNRGKLPYSASSGAVVELGGKASNQLVSYVGARNPAGKSCINIANSADTTNLCKNATLMNNDVGPAGASGTEADGISVNCTQSLVSNNAITATTDSGVKIFGGANSTISGNSIISSTNYTSFAGIALVSYKGDYTNITVYNNFIGGKILLNTGIAIGANVWNVQAPTALVGPVNITTNTITGQVTFPIPLNGWTNGITVVNTNLNGLVTQKSSFAKASNCSAAVQQLFINNSNLIYYPPGVTGPQQLQSDFVKAGANATNFLCTTPL